MRWRHRFLALAFMAAACSIYSQDSGGGRTALYTAETADYRQVLLRRTLAGLEGRTLDVRLYPNLDADPEKYVKVSVPVSGSALQLSAIKKTYPAVSRLSSVFFQASDQADQAIAGALRDCVFLIPYSENPFYPQWFSREGGKPYDPYWTFLDAEGKPIAGASVEIRILLYRSTPDSPDIQVKTATLDENGRISRLYCGAGRFVFTVRHSRYGSASISYLGNNNDPLSTFFIPLVAKDSPAAAQSIRGTIVDADGRPVKDAYIRANQLDLPGMPSSPRSGAANARFASGAITDEQGWFAFREAVLTEDLTSAQPAPAGRRYWLLIQPPKSTNLRQLSGQQTIVVQTGDQPRFTLTAMNAGTGLHTFAFKYPDRDINGADELGNITLTLVRDGRQWITLSYAEFKDGFMLPSGTMRAEMNQGNSHFSFPEVEIAADTPEQISFQMPAPVTYRGKVIDESSGKPMAGVYVVPGSYGSGRVESVTAQQWQSLQFRAEQYSKDESPGRAFYDSFNHVLLTDSDGCFEARLAPGGSPAILMFTALAPGYARAPSQLLATAPPLDSAGRQPFALRLSANGIVDVPVIKMTPLERVYFPRFIFEDEKGPVIDPEKLRAVRLTIKTDRGGLVCSLDQFLQKGEFSPGAYTADAQWDGRLYTFAAVDLSSSRPDTVVFKPGKVRSARVTYRGQVVDGASGKPIWGAVVFHNLYDTKVDAAQLEAEQWTALKSLGPDPQPDNPAFASLRALFGIAAAGAGQTAFAVTDRAGRFRIAIEQTNLVLQGSNLTVVAKGFLRIQQQLFMPSTAIPGPPQLSERFKPDAGGGVVLPVLRMPPAATVRMHAVVPDTGGYTGMAELRVLWALSPADAGEWFPDMLPSAAAKGNGVTIPSPSFLRANIDQALYIPAGVSLTLNILPVPSKESTLPLTLGPMKLARDQVKTLGRIEFAPSLPIIVKVTDESGRPIVGVAVSCSDATHDSTGSTDSAGTARLQAMAYSSGKIAFRTVDLPTGQQIEKSIPYRVGGPEDAGKVFILQIPEDFLKIYRTVKSPPIRRSVGVQGK